MFSIVNGVLLEPLKFRDPGRLYLARTVPPAREQRARRLSGKRSPLLRVAHSLPLLRSCFAAPVSGIDAGRRRRPGQTSGPRRLRHNFFQTLGVQPLLGRDFLPQEDAPGHWREVILTDALWRSRFAADPGIIGRTIQLNGESHTVVGVMPADLHLPKGDEWGAFFGPLAAPVIFRPLRIDASVQRPVGNLNYTSVIRLKSGISAEQATAELNALLADFVREFNLQTKITLIPLQRQVTRGSRSALWMLLGTVGAVLLIVCVNVGNLMLVRTAGRYREAGCSYGAGRQPRATIWAGVERGPASSFSLAGSPDWR